MDYGSATANELARLCAEASNEAAWLEFHGRFQRTVAITVLRTARGWGEPTSNEVDDLVQETFLRLCADHCKLLRTFVPREPDSIFGFLRKIAFHVTHDYFRSETSLKRGGDLRREDRDGDEVERLSSSDEPVRALEFEVQMDEIDRFLRGLPEHVLGERDRNIFWLYYCQGYSAREISCVRSYKLTEKGVESVLKKVTRLVREAMQPTISVGAKGNSGPFTIFKGGR